MYDQLDSLRAKLKKKLESLSLAKEKRKSRNEPHQSDREISLAKEILELRVKILDIERSKDNYMKATIENGTLRISNAEKEEEFFKKAKVGALKRDRPSKQKVVPGK